MKYLVLSLSLVLVPRPRAGEDGAMPRLSAWYRFEVPGEPGLSVGDTPWPAQAHRAEVTPEGRCGRGLYLPGEGANGLYLPNPVGFFGTKAWRGTIALWVKPVGPAVAGQQAIIDFMQDCGNTLIDGYETVILLDQGRVRARACLERTLDPDRLLPPDQWTHLALTWDCEVGTAFYVNGDKVCERQGKFPPTPLDDYWPGRVGCHTPGGGYPFHGTIDELRLCNYALTEAEVQTLYRLDVAPPVLRVSGDWDRALTVASAGAVAVTVSFEVWRPGRHLAPPFYGLLPTTFGARAWTAGASPVEVLAAPFRLDPDSSRRVELVAEPSYLGPLRFRAMAGDGLARQEALPESLTGEAKPWRGSAFREPADRRSRRGLVVEPQSPPPVVCVASAAPRIPASVECDLGWAYRGRLRVEFLDAAGKHLGEQIEEVRLADGRRRELNLSFAGEFPPGAYQVRVLAEADGAEQLINQWPVFITRAGDLRSACEVGASYTAPVDATALLEGMAADGVTFLRLHGKGDPCSFVRNQSTVMGYGFRVWNMPAASYQAVCTSPASRERLRQRAQDLGAYLRWNPAVLQQTIAGEGLNHPPCYCESCVRSFRDDLRRRFGSLVALNQYWGSTYQAWAAIQPLGSPQDLDETAERLKMMKVALELPKGNTERWRRLFELDRPRAMAWKRWHEQVLVDWYADFAKAFHAANGGLTPIGEQPCWPNFESHILFALGRIADAGGMDLYLPGEMPTSLGYAAELCLNFDLNASIFASAGKPLMVHELYVQDNSPAGLARAQGWWLLGRGYDFLTYFTYNYYLEGVRASLPLVFGLFDKEGKPYPCYASFQEFSRELREFHQRYDVSSLRRERPEVALFMGDDVSLANALETGGATWEAAGVHGHNGAYWLTERNGHTVEFVNDERLDRLAGKRLLVVPWCHLIRPESLRDLLRFARSGGTLLLDGPVGLYDEGYIPHSPQPGGRALAELGVSFDAYEDRPNRIVLADGVELPSRGVAVDLRVTRGEVLLRDATGAPAVLDVPVGRGRVIWLLTNLGRCNLARNPAPQALALWQTLLGRAGLTPRWHLTPTATSPSPPAGTATEGQKGGSFCDVSLRARGDREVFVFVVSFFEPAQGTLSLLLPAADYVATDALSGETVDFTRNGDRYEVGLDLPAFGSQVLRLQARAGKPLARW